MSRRLINRSPDLQRLRDAGYNIRHVQGHLVVWDVPYLDVTRTLRRGALISTVTLQNDVAVAPDDHTVFFVGSRPYDQDGKPLALVNNDQGGTLAGGLVWNFQFSQRLATGQNYSNYYDKFRRYIHFLTGPARVLFPDVTAATRQPVEADADESVFILEDTWSPKARISDVVERLTMHKVAIVGVGGTGAHILDLVAKTPVAEIHLFDGQTIEQRNIWRLPGATTRDIVAAAPNKAEHFAAVYSAFRRRIHSHPIAIDASSVDALAGMSFVFICIDKGKPRGLIGRWLSERGIPFIDVGMGVNVTDDQKLRGMVRTTFVAPGGFEAAQLPCDDNDDLDDDLYNSNVQIVELNMLNAALAVLRWKKHSGVYADLKAEPNSLYVTATNKIINRAGDQRAESEVR